MSFSDLPALNAALNGLSALFLSLGYYHIRAKREDLHRKFMVAAFSTSILFLISYLTYHTYNAVYLGRGPTRFLDPAWFRPIYLLILLSHTVLAAAVVPLAITSVYLGFRDRRKSHARISRFTWPIWMYVSVTGVVIYLLLYQIFPQTPPPKRETNLQGAAWSISSAMEAHGPEP